jgi:hypothetical protein
MTIAATGDSRYIHAWRCIGVAMKNGRKQMVLRDAKAVNAHLWPGAITARAPFPHTSPVLSGSVNCGTNTRAQDSVRCFSCCGHYSPT